jgi:ATP-dependent RNA helicase RhlE
MSFDTLGLSDNLLRAVREKGYDTPSPIQALAIPAVLKGQDIMAAAQTGTGKTAGFTLPILQRLAAGTPAKGGHIRTLVLTPTRELAAQVQDSIRTYGAHTHIRSAVVFGGVGINPQIALLRRGVDVLVATPGRLLDLYNQRAINFSQVEILVLDEADRMLDMGFINDIKKILALLPKQRQNLLFSATFSGEIRALAKGLLNSPVEIDVAPRNTTTELVEQLIYTCDKARKPELLSHLINSNGWHQALVFSRTKHGADKLVRLLERDKIQAAAIHGNKSQNARTKALADFKSGKVQILVATDIAARGIDIKELPQVVNFDLPNVPEDYVHRIGRTGRAGANGKAVSLVSADEVKQLGDIERVIGRLLPREEVDGFEPQHNVPETRLNSKPRQQQSRGDGQARNSGQARSNNSPRSNSSPRGDSPGRSNNAGRSNGPARDGQSRSDQPRSNQARASQPRSGQPSSNQPRHDGAPRGDAQARPARSNGPARDSQPRGNDARGDNRGNDQRGNDQRSNTARANNDPRNARPQRNDSRPRRTDSRPAAAAAPTRDAPMRDTHPRDTRLRSYSHGGDSTGKREFGDDTFKPRRSTLGGNGNR